jgi:hypothetical protein
MAWQSAARLGLAGRGAARRGRDFLNDFVARPGMAWFGMAGCGGAWRGTARRGPARHGEVGIF